jgi:hypothetical protein
MSTTVFTSFQISGGRKAGRPSDYFPSIDILS